MRIRLKFQRKFSAEKVFLFLAILCVSSFALLEYMSISVPIFSVVKNPLLYIGGFCILTQIKLLIKCFLKKKYIYTWLLLLVFCAFLFLSAYANHTLVALSFTPKLDTAFCPSNNFLGKSYAKDNSLRRMKSPFATRSVE